MLFCTTCIKGNFGEKILSEFQAAVWRCCCCSPTLLQQLTVECEKALSAGGLSVSTSDSDSGDSESDTINGLNRYKLCSSGLLVIF